MIDIRVAESLWSTAMMPEGVVEKWLKADGAHVSAGLAICVVRIEDALHDIVAPASGRLEIDAQANDVIEPGALLGRIAAPRRGAEGALVIDADQGASARRAARLT
jgi:pyruvate/2-oxoglutarate dehydrogenase complex dihydrolipoamide acyltransferase (E2) component